MTLPQLQKLTKIWQGRLGLKDWKITVTDRRELGDSESTHGYCRCIRKYKMARLYIQLDQTQLISSILPFDPEQTLVHEMLHCKFPFDFDDNAYNTELLEEGIDSVARLMVELYRR